MAAYYNEFDPKTAAWLRELIKAGLIADGEVDTRSIVEVQPSDLAGFTQCHFFAGIGGWSYALRKAGWADDRSVWTGSCPCQPFSLAGAQQGFDDPRHLWPQFLRLIAIGRPTVILGEQVASASKWLGLVRSNLETLDYAVGAMPVQAASAGADHLRDRYWFVGNYQGDGRGEGRPEYEVQLRQSAATARNGCSIHMANTASNGERRAWESGEGSESQVPTGRLFADSGIGLADANNTGSQGRPLLYECASERPSGQDGMADTNQLSTGQQWEQPSDWVIGADGKARRVKPGIRLLANGFPARVGLLRGFGNAIDPRPAAAFIKAVMDSI